MSSQYPVLDSKPIDQWRVTDLREELRRRKLVTKGLKEELVKRLDEAMQKDLVSEDVGQLGSGDEPSSASQSNTNEDQSPEGAEDMQTMLDDGGTNNDASLININHSVPDVNQGCEDQSDDAIEVVPSDGKDEDRLATSGCIEGNGPHSRNFNALSGMQGEDAADKKFGESNSPLAGIDEKTSDSEGVAPVNYPVVQMDEKRDLGDAPVEQNIVSQFDAPDEDAGPVEILESKPPIVRIDVKEAILGDLNGIAPFNQNITIQSSIQEEDAELVKFVESEPLAGESTVIQLEQSNQVSEVIQDFEFQVKYKSISTDSVSINEKNNIKDNLTADRFPLELVVKQEVSQPSSSSYPTGGGHSCLVVDEQEAAKSHVSDVREGLKNPVLAGIEVVHNFLSDKQETSISYAADEQCALQTHVSYQQGKNEEHACLNVDIQSASSLDHPKKEECVEASSPEKLNLDRSSGDESMEEDMLDAKHIEHDIKSVEPDMIVEATMLDIKLEEKAVDEVSISSSKMKDITGEDVNPASLTEKRKLEEPEVAVNNGPPKRHRRWNPDAIKVPDQQTLYTNVSNTNISATPRNNLQPTLRRTFSTSSSTTSVDSPKERFVPTPKKPATTSLRIDNFLRPFTLKAVQELLAKTGQVCDFWMDHIKTHCYVTYSSAEEATETRNAVYNLQWPPNGGRFLAADFVDPQEVRLRLEAPQPSPAPISSLPSTPKAPPSQQIQAPPPQQPQAPKPAHQQNVRLPPPPPPPAHLLPPPPLLVSNQPVARERLPPPPKKPEPPVLTLDDLFKKTRATPRIYYLPLTEEQVSAKLAIQSKRAQF